MRCPTSFPGSRLISRRTKALCAELLGACQFRQPVLTPGGAITGACPRHIGRPRRIPRGTATVLRETLGAGNPMTQTATVERFTRVDTSVDPKFFVRFVDMANEMASVQACKRRIEALLEPRVGQRILDLGCGTGDDARALARLGGGDCGRRQQRSDAGRGPPACGGALSVTRVPPGRRAAPGSARPHVRWRSHGADLHAS